MHENISERVKELRTEQGMTLAELGENAKLSTSYLSQIERDKTSPSLSTLMSIARALNVEPRYFFEIETEPAYIKRADRGKDSHASSSPIVRLLLTPKVGNNKLETYRLILQPHAVPK